MADNNETRLFPCPTGYIITNENGQYLPFLLKTRTEDIVYGNMDFSDEFLQFLMEHGCNSIDRYYPSPEYKFKLEDWECTLKDNNHIVATKEITIGNIEKDFSLVDSIEAIYYEDNIIRFERNFYEKVINFPFTLYRKTLMVDQTLNAYSSEMRSSVLSIDTSKQDGDELNQITLALVVNEVPSSRADEVMEYHESSDSIRIFSKYMEYYKDGLVFDDDMEVGLTNIAVDNNNLYGEEGFFLPENDGVPILEMDDGEGLRVLSDLLYIEDERLIIDESIMKSDTSDEYNESIYLAFRNQKEFDALKSCTIFLRIEGEISNLNVFTDKMNREELNIVSDEEETE